MATRDRRPRPLSLPNLAPALTVLGAAALLSACPKPIPVEERLPPPPPLARGRVDDGPIAKVKRPSRLTADPTQEYAPAPSPDGSVLAYVSHHAGNADIYLRFLPGSGRVGEYPVVSHYAADTDPAWSPNGRQIAFVSRRDDPKGDLYIYNLKTGDAVPDAVRAAVLEHFGSLFGTAPSDRSAAEAEQLDRVSEFLEKRDPVIRLSDAEREDRGPAWSPDGHRLYYAARLPGQPENIWAMDLRKFDAQQVTTDGGFDPAPSADGKYLAYTARVGNDSRLRVRRLSDGATLDVTRGEALDGFPAWSHDGKSLFFVRYAIDSNDDGAIDVRDRPQIWQIPFDADAALASPKAYREATPWPVTPEGRYDLFPRVAGGRLFYSSDDGKNSDVFAIPEAGVFPALSSGEAELALADALVGEPQLRLLLLDQTAARRPADSAASQEARLAAAHLRADLGELSSAKSALVAILGDSRVTGARRARAQVLFQRVAALTALKSGPGGSIDKTKLRRAADELEKLASGFSASEKGGTDTAALKAAKAEALLEAGNARAAAGDVLAATEDWQRAVKEGDGWPRAEAWLAAASAYGDLGQSDRGVATFVAALKAYPDLIVPAERRAAVERERNTNVDRIAKAIAAAASSAPHTKGIDPAQLPDVGVPETYGERAAEGVAYAAILGAKDARTGAVDPATAIASLRDVAASNRDLPVLPSLARNEIGDLYVRLGDTASAAMEFSAVAESGADPRQVQRARLSAAKALLVEGRYEEAVKALGPPPSPEIPAGAAGVLARRARKAYVKTLLARADEEFRGHDYALARKSYRAVLAVDAREVRAHRGLIACYATLGEADRAAKIYEDEAAKTPDDPLIRYGVGLAYSYRTPESKWMPRAEEELKKAVFLDDSQVFPHQTLGFVYEKEEELLGEKNGFERAADQYLLALSLNDPSEDFHNQADLELNVGNAFFGLENYRRAYEYYAKREKRDVPFDVKGRELVYRERFAKSAFESNRLDESVKRYDAALAFLDTLDDKELPAKSRAEHRARLLDERAFAIDAQGDASAAAAAFIDAAKANSIAGNEQNSAKALRNAAIQLFEKGTGETDYGATTGTAGVMVDKAALVDALDYLGESLQGVEKRGAALHKAPKKKRHGLFHYDMTFSLSNDASEAIEGFDTKAEKELIYTFLGRIYASLDDAQRARDYYEKKLAMLPAKVPAAQQPSVDFKRSLLQNQVGVLAWQTGDAAAAWTSLDASYHTCVSVGNVHGAMVNAIDVALAAIELRDADHREKALALLDEAIDLLDHTGTPDPERYIAGLHAARAELSMEKAAAIVMPAPGASTDAIRAAAEALAEQGRLLGSAEKDEVAARSAIDGSVKGFAGINRDRVAVLHSLARLANLTGRTDEAAARYAAASKAASDHGMPGLAAQIDVEAAVALGKDDAALDAALTALEAVPSPILARELDPIGIEPYYRRLARPLLAKGDALAAIGVMERLRALQLVAAAAGTIPLPKGGDAAEMAKVVDARRIDLLRAWRSATSADGKADDDAAQARKDALAKAIAAWNSSLDDWGPFDEQAWTLAHVSTFDSGSLFAALPTDGAFVYFVEQPDALWAITCRAAACSAANTGAAPSNATAMQAAAAKAITDAANAAGKSSRVQVVVDAGLYDTAWIPGDLRTARVIAVHRSAQQVVASFARRGPYRERQDDAATAGAKSFLAAAPIADVLRLDVTGAVPAGDPLDARWEVSLPDGPPPVRAILARDVIAAGPHAALVVADVEKDADPETLLLLGDLFVRAGAGTVAFVPPEQTAWGDAVGKGDKGLAGAPALLCGHPGMNAAELKAFGDEQIEANEYAGKAAQEDKRWDDSMQAFDRALYLLDALKLDPARKVQVLEAQAISAFYAQEWTRGARYGSEYVALLDQLGKNGPELGEGLIILGAHQQRAEQYEEAAATLSRAAKRFEELGKKEGRARSLTSLGATFESALHEEKAIEAYRAAMEIDEGLGAASGVGGLYRRIGRVYYQRLEDYAAAEKAFAAARDAYAKAKDPSGEDEARLELGLIDERRGMLDDSKKAYQEVFDRATKRKDKAVATKAELYLANTAWLSGDYQTAFTHVRHVRRAAGEMKDARLAFLARSTEGLIDWTLNDLSRATALQKEALEMARALPSPIDEASTWNNLGIIYRSAEQYDQAIDAFQRASEIDGKFGSKWGRAYDLRNLGLTYLKSGDPARAADPLQEAVNLSAEIGDKVNGAKALLALADYHSVAGDTAKAKALYQRALEGSLASHLPEVTWRAHDGLAKIARAAGDSATARSELDAALQVVEDMRGAIKVEELKNGFISDKLDLYDDAIQLALDDPPKGADRAELSWSYSERSRARSFIDLLANRHIALATPEDNKAIDEQRALKDRIFAAEDALAKAPAADKPARKQALDALREQYRDLLVEIRAANPKLSAFVTVDPPTLADVRKVLGKDTALLEYHVGPKETVVWTITDKTIRVTRLPLGRGALRKDVKAYLADLEAVRPVDERERALGKALLEPALGPDIAGKRFLGIIPHGPLHYIPFAALKVGDDYLIDKWSPFYVPSAAVLPLSLKNGPSVAPGSAKEMSKVLAIGNPDLGDPSFSLPFADLEVGDLKLDFPQIDVLTHERATDRWVAANIGKYRVIHFAAHGEFDPVNPLFSAIRLAHDADEKGNGALTAHDIFGIPMHAELVTLSACQTGISKIEGGDELIGLNRAFLYAGTRSVMSTLWRVHDGSTAVLVKHFYRNYTVEAKADALRDAMRSVRQYYPHPAYWAAFALTGDYR